MVVWTPVQANLSAEGDKDSCRFSGEEILGKTNVLLPMPRLFLASLTFNHVSLFVYVLQIYSTEQTNSSYGGSNPTTPVSSPPPMTGIAPISYLNLYFRCLKVYKYEFSHVTDLRQFIVRIYLSLNL